MKSLNKILGATRKAVKSRTARGNRSARPIDPAKDIKKVESDSSDTSIDAADFKRTFAFVTTCSKDGWDLYGRRFVDSFLEKFPESVSLYIYIDFKLKIENTRLKIRHLDVSCPGLAGFQNGLGRFSFANGKSAPFPTHEQGLDARVVWNAWKFSFKVFSVEHAVLNATEDIMIWIDADSFAFAPLGIDVLDMTNPESFMLSYLGRSWKYSECGYVGYNVRHPLTESFVRCMSEMYSSGQIFSLNEWHDSYVFDAVRLAFEASYGVKNHNISADVSNLDHVFINSVLGRYLDHMKGGRKADGRSRIEDISVHTDLDYWSRDADPVTDQSVANAPGSHSEEPDDASLPTDDRDLPSEPKLPETDVLHADDGPPSEALTLNRTPGPEKGRSV